MPKHIMIDIETLGRKPGVSILSIGAVEFDPTDATKGFARTFYVAIDMKSCGDIGLTIDAYTLSWWLQKSPAAREAAFGGETPIKVALRNFYEFVRPSKDTLIWAHSPQLDCAILEEACLKTSSEFIKVPWEYWQLRDARTVCALAGVYPTERQFWPHGSTPHNALDDAKAQSLAVAAAFEVLHCD